MTPVLERTWKIKAHVDKYASEADHAAGIISDVVEVEHNLLLNAGITRILDLMKAAGGQAWDATHSRIGVGDTNTAAAATQTDLQAAASGSNRQWKLVDQGPTVAGQTTTWRATFASGEANFAWAEWGIDQGTADGTAASSTTMLNRKVASLGTKVSGAVWVFTVTLTIS